MSDSEDDLVAYGTPLEPLEEDEIPNKKPRLLEDQIATDKEGRRRFHGAFTGGFSAGFFNTVGSLEGWTPSSFKSSKSKKQELLQQKPEDFMDEEDLSEFGIAPLVLKARKGYRIENKTDSPAFSQFSALGNYTLENLLKPVRETVGMKLLKKMGWKPGQGVGPRMNKREKENTLKMRQKTYGCQLPSGILEVEEPDPNSDSDLDDIEFAPTDYEPVLCEARNNFWGLGYEGLNKGPVLSGNQYAKADDIITERNKKLKFGSQAFGVGAFEEEDEDIYARDDMSRYDFALGKDPSSEEKKSTEKNSSSLESVLEGFTLETKRRIRKNYPLPVLPREYKARKRISRFDQPPNNKENFSKSTRVNFEGRKKLLDESSPPSVRNIQQRRDRDLDWDVGEEIREAKKKEEALAKQLISSVNIKENKFRPFAANPEKQERYENYLKLVKIGKKELLNSLQPFTMTDWDKEREKLEFEKAALLFKPLSGGMEDRFATASQPDDISDPLAVVEKYVDESDDRKKAARMNMYGPLTRRTEDWAPDPLLCKRFNIVDPKKSQPAEKHKQKPRFNLYEALLTAKDNTEPMETPSKSQEPPAQERTRHEEAKPEIPEPKDKDTEANDPQDKTDLFKAIFLASDDDDDEDEPEEKEQPKEEDKPREDNARESFEDHLYEEKVINSKRNLSPPSGIFKGLDLELLCGGRKTGADPAENAQKREEVPPPPPPRETGETNFVYGPKIPEKVPVKSDFLARQDLEEEGVWVEKKSHSKKKHKKKNKKEKKSSHKSKHKHKDRKR